MPDWKSMIYCTLGIVLFFGTIAVINAHLYPNNHLIEHSKILFINPETGARWQARSLDTELYEIMNCSQPDTPLTQIRCFVKEKKDNEPKN